MPTNGVERSRAGCSIEVTEDWIAGEQLVAKSRIQRKVEARTTYEWRGHPFTVGIIIGDLANIYYTGKDFDTLVHLPGMERPDKYEVQGQVPVSELSYIKQFVEDVPLQPSVPEETREARGSTRR